MFPPLLVRKIFRVYYSNCVQAQSYSINCGHIYIYISSWGLLNFPFQRQPLCEIFGIAMDAIHSFFLTILIAFLNNVNIRNIGHIRTYKSLKIALVVFCSCLAISWLTSVFGIGVSLGSKNDWLIAIGQILLLPFYQKAIELLWTKIFRDEKCIIGEISSQNDENRHSSAV